MKRKLTCIHSTLQGFTVGKKYLVSDYSILGYRCGKVQDNDGAVYHCYRDCDDDPVYVVSPKMVRFE